MLATSGLSFLAFLNATFLNVALPDISSALGADLGLVSWTATGYVAALAAGLIAGGRLADAVGRRRVLIVGAMVFALASVGCALAPSAGVLIAARTAQGAAAALITPASFGLLLEATADDRRGPAIGVWSAAAATSAFVGPPVGGIMVDLASWRTPFALDAATACALVALTIRLRVVSEPRRDLPAIGGVVVGGVAVAMLVLATAQAGEWGWSDPRVLAGLAAGAAGVGVGVFGSAERGWRVVDRGLLVRPTFAAANALSIVFAFAAFSWLLAAPLFVATVWNWDALAAACSVAPGAVAAALAAWGAGRLPRRARPWSIVLGGSALSIAALILTQALSRSPDFVTVWLPAGVATGLAVGAALASLTAIVADAIPGRDFAQGAGINMTARQFGGALGVAAVAALVGAHGHLQPSAFTALWLVIAGASAITALGGAALQRSEAQRGQRDRHRRHRLSRYACVRL